MLFGGKKISEIDMRLLCFTWAGFYTGAMGLNYLFICMPSYHRSSGRKIKDFTPEDLKIAVLFYLVLGFIVFLSMRSSKITGIQTKKVSIFSILYLFLVYKFVSYFHLYVLLRNIPLIELIIKTAVYYYLSHEVLFGFLLLWLVNNFGREKCYTHEKCYITQKGLYCKLYLEDRNMTFLLNNKSAKIHYDEMDRTIYLDEIYVKSLFFCNRKLITEMW